MKIIITILLVCVISSSSAQDIENPRDTIFIYFKGKSVKINKSSQKILDSLSVVLKADASLGIRIINSTDHCEKCGMRSWDRINNTVKYLTSKGVDADHLFPFFLLNGENNTIAIVTGRWVNTELAQPHPGLKITGQ
jgi:hypothetical protein